MMPAPYVLVVVAAVVFTLAGVYQGKSRLLRFAFIAGWLGPLPGFFYEFLPVMARDARTEPALAAVRNFLLFPLPYLIFVMPSFGLYCFVVGLLAGWAIFRCGRSPLSWAQPAAIVVCLALAAVPPWLLIGMPKPAACASLFWGAVLLYGRRRFFAPAEADADL